MSVPRQIVVTPKMSMQNPLTLFAQPQHAVVKGIGAIPGTSAFFVWGYLTTTPMGVFLSQIQVFAANDIDNCKKITEYFSREKINTVVAASNTHLLCQLGTGQVLFLKLDCANKTLTLDSSAPPLICKTLRVLGPYVACTELKTVGPCLVRSNTTSLVEPKTYLNPIVTLYDSRQAFKKIATFNAMPCPDIMEYSATEFTHLVASLPIHTMVLTADHSIAMLKENGIIQLYKKNEMDVFETIGTTYHADFLTQFENYSATMLPTGDLFICNTETVVTAEKQLSVETNNIVAELSKFYLYNITTHSLTPLAPHETIYMNNNKSILSADGSTYYSPSFQGISIRNTTTGAVMTRAIFSDWKETFLGLTANHLLIIVHNGALFLLETINNANLIKKVASQILAAKPLPLDVAEIVSQYYLDQAFFTVNLRRVAIECPPTTSLQHKNKPVQKSLCRVM